MTHLFLSSLASSGALLFLLDLLLKSALILAIAGLCTSLMRHKSASARHAVWGVALIGLLFLPVLVGLLPSWHIDLLPEIQLPRLYRQPALQKRSWNRLPC